MAPSTRLPNRSTPPPDRYIVREADTVKRTRFFDAFDARSKDESILSICKDLQVTTPTARRWLRQRNLIGQTAYRRTRKISLRLGRPFSVSQNQLEMLISPSQNPVRNQTYEAQLDYHNIPLSKRGLQRTLTRRANGSRRYKQTYIGKLISQTNRQKRLEYGKTYQSFSGHILRPPGAWYEPQNIQQRGEKNGVKLHIAAWVNWHGKGELRFYNDENNHTVRPRRRTKPRESKYETDKDFAQRIREWKASLQHKREYKPKGNSMTQKYYYERLLPYDIDAIS
ncbi:hypothetical protein N7G274_009256 [Stereocaulon virgatum]|uniref:HNH homing endonuclease n=1 Tax=Stereocaulon virgatum TaxID=373712 RepID=A0ABR3ZYG6_9LECA